MEQDRPLWMQILQHLYEDQGDMVDRKFASGYGDGPPDGFKTDRQTFDRAIEGMKKTELITSINEGESSPNDQSEDFHQISLTETGFQVAHDQATERAESKRQHRQNRAIGFLTLGLLLTGAFQAVAMILTDLTPTWKYSLVILIVLLVLAIMFSVWNSGMLAPYSESIDV